MEPQFECIFRPTVPMQAERLFRIKEKAYIGSLVVSIVYFLFVCYFLYSAYYVVGVPVGAGAVALALFAVAMLLYGCFSHYYAAWRQIRRFQKNPAAQGVFHFVFGDEITCYMGDAKSTWKYSAILETYRYQRSYELHMNTAAHLIILPEGFTKGTFPEFLQFLREKRPDLIVQE